MKAYARLNIVEGLQDYFLHELKFPMDKKMDWLGQLSLIESLEKIGDQV